MTLSFQSSKACAICNKMSANDYFELPKDLVCQDCRNTFYVCPNCASFGCPSCRGELLSRSNVFPYTAFKAISEHDLSRLHNVLSENDAFIHHVINEEGNTPLIESAIHQDYETCCWLLKNQLSDVNEINRVGRTALIEMVRFRSNNKFSRKLCVRLRDSVNVQDCSGKTALMYAVKGAGAFGSNKGNISIVKQLVEFGADLNLVNHDGRTALGEAKRCSKKSKSENINGEIIEYLQTQMTIQRALYHFRKYFNYKFSDLGVLKVWEKT